MKPTKRLYSWMIIIILTCLSSGRVLADMSGQAIYQQQCGSCHGVDGAGNPALKSPSIGGLTTKYLSAQLTHFRDGIRGSVPGDIQGRMMSAIAQPLSDESIELLSRYTSTLPIPKLYTEIPNTGFRGRGLYSGCLSCHGSQGEGYPELGSPRISQQYDWYIADQLKKFRSGQRGFHPTDERGLQMRDMAVGIASEEDIELLSRYATGLGVK